MPLSHSPFHAPIADYEPPAFGGPPRLPPLVAPRLRRRAPVVAACAPPPRDERTRAAAVFADAALRRVLEVIDRRRPAGQLRPLMAAGLLDSLLAGAARHGGAEPARLRRVVAQPTGPDATAAEVAASYTRAGRVHAVACRVEQLSTPTGPRWQLVALHLG